VLDAIYGFNPGDVYAPQIADPVKWAADGDAVDGNLSRLFSLYVRLGLKHPETYLEAFFAQNIPYYLPGSDMLYRFDLGVIQMDMFPIATRSYFPSLRSVYEAYDQTLTFWRIPGVRLLSDTAFFVWLCVAALGFAVYQRQRQWIAGLAYLLAIWITCLLGPVALIRYMLGFFYGVPVILAAMSAPALPTRAPASGPSAGLTPKNFLLYRGFPCIINRLRQDEHWGRIPPVICP
jgi:hypothetical protein